MDDLIAFVRARLDDQHAALIAYRDHRASEGQCVNVLGDDPAEYEFDEYDSCAIHLKTAAATPYRDTDYGLAEVEAKRQLLDWLVNLDGIAASDNLWNIDTTEPFLRLALPYASHPDYREEWRPEG